MPSSPASCLLFDKVGCVTVYVENHFARGKSYDRVRVRRDVVKELKGLLHCFFSVGLAWSDAIALNATSMVESTARL